MQGMSMILQTFTVCLDWVWQKTVLNVAGCRKTAFKHWFCSGQTSHPSGQVGDIKRSRKYLEHTICCCWRIGKSCLDCSPRLCREHNTQSDEVTNGAMLNQETGFQTVWVTYSFLCLSQSKRIWRVFFFGFFSTLSDCLVTLNY